MKLKVDEYAHLQSPIHQWEPRSKLIGLLALIFAFSFVRDLRLLPAMLGITAVLYGVSRLPLSFLRQRLRYPSYFLLGVVILLPFFSGETVVWQWGMLTLRQEGIWAALLVVCRFLSIIITGFVLLGTTPFLTLIKAMRSLGLPSILADMTLLTYRYLYEIADNLSQMQQAMRLRGFRSASHQTSRKNRWLLPGWHHLEKFAALAGTLFVHSYEQSERVYQAMRLRGYGHQPLRTAVALSKPTSTTSTRSVNPSWSAIALTLTLLIAASFVAAELFFKSMVVA